MKTLIALIFSAFLIFLLMIIGMWLASIQKDLDVITADIHKLRTSLTLTQ